LGFQGEEIHFGVVKSISKRLFISFLIYRNRDFDEKLASNRPIGSSNEYPKIDILYSGFYVSQRWRVRMTL
jgi:hypothetical protein